MKVSMEVVNKIREEEKKYKFGREFGGYLVVEDDEVKDIIFDVKESSFSRVKFGAEELMKIPEEQRKNVRGWFHKHSVDELSQVDVMTTMQLTDFWGECYTLILQRNGYLLLLKTIKGTDFIFRKPIVIETHRYEIECRNNGKKDGGIKHGFFSLSKSIFNPRC